LLLSKLIHLSSNEAKAKTFEAEAVADPEVLARGGVGELRHAPEFHVYKQWKTGIQTNKSEHITTLAEQ